MFWGQWGAFPNGGSCLMVPMVGSHEGQGAVQRAPGEYGDRGGRTGREQPHWLRGSQDGPGWPVPQEPEAAPVSALSPAPCVGFWGVGRQRGSSTKPAQGLSPTEPQLPGKAPGPRWAAAATCARATSQPWEPLPGTSFAFPTSSQPLLGAKQLPMTLPPAATALAASRSLC